jgi:hypothetical protein
MKAVEIVHAIKEKQNVSAFITEDSTLAIMLTVAPFDALERVEVYKNIFNTCTITAKDISNKESSITIQGTIAALLRVINILHTVFQPGHLKTEEADSLKTELSGLSNAIETARSKKKSSRLNHSTHGLFSSSRHLKLNAKSSTVAGNVAFSKKKSASDEEQHTSNSDAISPRTRSFSVSDTHTLTLNPQAHNNSPTSETSPDKITPKSRSLRGSNSSSE